MIVIKIASTPSLKASSRPVRISPRASLAATLSVKRVSTKAGWGRRSARAIQNAHMKDARVEQRSPLVPVRHLADVARGELDSEPRSLSVCERGKVVDIVEVASAAMMIRGSNQRIWLPRVRHEGHLDPVTLTHFHAHESPQVRNVRRLCGAGRTATAARCDFPATLPNARRRIAGLRKRRLNAHRLRASQCVCRICARLRATAERNSQYRRPSNR